MNGGNYAGNSRNIMMVHQGAASWVGQLGGIIALLIAVVVLVDLILVGMILWKKINKKEK